MIAHVAAAGESRGRVVLSAMSGFASPIAIEAALLVAKAFEAELESLCVEDRQLFEVARYAFAREVSLSGRRTQALSPDDVARQLRGTFAALQRRVNELARAVEIPTKSTVVRGEPVAALAQACAECGPWNVVALAEPLNTASGSLLSELFASVKDATGVIAVGPKARRTDGPIVVAIEDVAHLEPMLRAAAKLISASGIESITVLLIAGNAEQVTEMEGQARLLLGEVENVTIAGAVARYGLAAEVAETLRRQHGRFVLAQFGGLAVPGDRELRHLVSALEAPLFLMR